VENRPGASGTVAALAGTRAPPDGHTLFMTTVSASAVVPPQMSPPPFDIHRDQTAIVLAATVPLVVVVPPSSPARDLRGLIERARANPGALNYSSSGVATQQHLAAELLAARAGARMTHVPFRGTGQAVNEILAGRIDLAIDTFPTYLPHVREGRVRALATTMPARIEWLPGLPTVAETRFPGFEAPDFDANVWYMLMGPAGLPAAVTERLAASVNRALNDPTLRPRIRDAGFIPGGGPAAPRRRALRRADPQRRHTHRIGRRGASDPLPRAPRSSPPVPLGQGAPLLDRPAPAPPARPGARGTVASGGRSRPKLFCRGTF
jgi:tripartite-type tricarboxylate transporter receptor subunit TctC